MGPTLRIGYFRQTNILISTKSHQINIISSLQHLVLLWINGETEQHHPSKQLVSTTTTTTWLRTKAPNNYARRRLFSNTKLGKKPPNYISNNLMGPTLRIGYFRQTNILISTKSHQINVSNWWHFQ
ncbi:hypothetical protein Lal_00028487 [Lupinus albus]|nr:hypothetical protein Lal_00028487 [Lupinus albus]